MNYFFLWKLEEVRHFGEHVLFRRYCLWLKGKIYRMSSKVNLCSRVGEGSVVGSLFFLATLAHDSKVTERGKMSVWEDTAMHVKTAGLKMNPSKTELVVLEKETSRQRTIHQWSTWIYTHKVTWRHCGQRVHFLRTTVLEYKNRQRITVASYCIAIFPILGIISSMILNHKIFPKMFW